jgi:type II secretory pathway predicted ATPase ExeA
VLEVKNVLRTIEQKQADLARFLSVSDATLSLIVNRNEWPKSIDHDGLKQGINDFLRANGATDQQLSNVFDVATELVPLKPKKPEPELKPAPEPESEPEEEIMLLRKQTMTQEARRQFGFGRSPFDEVRNPNEVFLTPDSRYVREAMRQTARHGGFMAVVGESGAGKSTLRRDLVQWAHADQQVTVIEPYVLGLEDNDMAGKTLKASHIAEAIMTEIAPHIRLARSPETRFRTVHEALRESHRAGNRHVLIIEEAHGLPIPTLKHLKRFFELEDGFEKLLGIILIGQTELGQKLDERNPRVREIVQRCEIVHLRPIDIELTDYLRHRFAMSGRNVDELMDTDAVEALRYKLSGRGHSVLYPLAIHNVLIAAFNEAAALGMPSLNADLITEV